MNKRLFGDIALVLAVFAVVARCEVPEVIYKEHVIGYAEEGRFCGWPANGGIWAWGNEMAVAFEMGVWQESSGNDHHRDPDFENEDVVIRSLDGGATWSMKKHPNLGGCDTLQPSPSDINFQHENFGYKAQNERFYLTYDRAVTWLGCYELATLGCSNPSSRTDYIVDGPGSCTFFTSCDRDPDRAFCFRTTNGGGSYQFLGWMGPDDGTRSVMPSTVRISSTKLVSAMRRKGGGNNWIDVYASNNNGQSWQFLSKVADTDDGDHNGNPPAMVRMTDGRLVVAYGYRAAPYGIRAKVSDNDGQSWSDEIHLRDDGLNWDLGYPRMIQRPDGKLVTAYYYTTAARPHQFIGVTIWQLAGTAGDRDINGDGVVNFLDYSGMLQ